MNLKQKQVKNWYIFTAIIFFLLISLSYGCLLISTNNYIVDDNLVYELKFKKNIILSEPHLSSPYLDENAGISAYFDIGKELNLSIVKSEFKTISVETSEYIIGSLSLPGLPESHDIHCLVYKNGTIYSFYLKNNVSSIIIDWNFYSDGNLTKDKLFEGLEIVANLYSESVTDVKYVHFQHKNADELMLVMEDAIDYNVDSFNIYLPGELTYYEKSWNHNGVNNNLGNFSGELTPDEWHEVTVTMNIDGVDLSDVGWLPGGIAWVGVSIIYNSSSSSEIQVQDADGIKTFELNERPTTHTEVTKGIDVSHHQEDINWTKVYQNGTKFAFVKATGGRYDNIILLLPLGAEGIILDHENNNIYADGYNWWYISFELSYGAYIGWCAQQGGLEEIESNNSEFQVGDRVKTIARYMLRESPKKVEHTAGWNDEYFIENMEMADEQDILVGAYHFAWPNIDLEWGELEENAKIEAEHFINVTGDYLKDGYLRPALDIEDKGIIFGTGKNISDVDNHKAKLSQWIYTWMEYVYNETEVRPILYVTKSYTQDYLEESLNQYDLWIAHWTYDTDDGPEFKLWETWVFWQYSNESFVDGIDGYVDANLFNGSLSDLENYIIDLPGSFSVTEFVSGYSWLVIISVIGLISIIIILMNRPKILSKN